MFCSKHLTTSWAVFHLFTRIEIGVVRFAFLFLLGFLFICLVGFFLLSAPSLFCNESDKNPCILQHAQPISWPQLLLWLRSRGAAVGRSSPPGQAAGSHGSLGTGRLLVVPVQLPHCWELLGGEGQVPGTAAQGSAHEGAVGWDPCPHSRPLSGYRICLGLERWVPVSLPAKQHSCSGFGVSASSTPSCSVSSPSSCSSAPGTFPYQEPAQILCTSCA